MFLTEKHSPENCSVVLLEQMGDYIESQSLLLVRGEENHESSHPLGKRKQ